jgi:hypothetical protein
LIIRFVDRPKKEPHDDDALIRVYDEAGNVIETHKDVGW